jgi:hypothetical protein
MRFIAIGIAIIMLASALAYRFVPHSAPPIALSDTASATSATAYDIDTDHDGVPDWQEQLFGTDPNNALSVPATTTLTSINSNASTTMTTALAHVMLQQYLLNTQGGSTALPDPAALSSAIANSVTIPTPTYHVYQAADIKTVASTPANRDAYRTALEAALAPMNHAGDAEIALYSRAIGGDAAAKAQLEAIAATYAAADTVAAHVSTPSDAVLVQLNALNSLGYYTAVLRDLVQHTDDPIGSLVLLRAYNDAEQGVFASFTSLREYLSAPTTSS